ncbi:hypothetical protein Bca4012_037531 [Brassica carinata]|uniref:Uncharacterized protein n=1 Tax=Brassica carinata TaxID=52824 RepID=A0A8X8BBH3_BRACI|nr:hypothetical protein Bca52824_011101 [Brassica carinata]
MMKLGRKVLAPSEASRSHELRREEVCGGVVPATVPRVVSRVEMEATRVVLTAQIFTRVRFPRRFDMRNRPV